VAEFLKYDKYKENRVNFSAFQQVMNNLELPTYLNNGKTLSLLFQEMGGQDNTINYKTFIEKLRTFRYDWDARRGEFMDEQVSTWRNPIVAEKTAKGLLKEPTPELRTRKEEKKRTVDSAVILDI